MTRTLPVLALMALALPAVAAKEVWTTSRRIDTDVFVDGKTLVVKPGVRLTFGPKGTLRVRDAGLRAEGAEFVGEGVLTNAFRVRVENGGIDLVGCRVRTMRSKDPVKGYGYYTGAFYSQFGNGARIKDCVFIDSSAVAYLNARKVRVENNVFLRPDTGVYLFNVTECLVTGNGFFDAPQQALLLNGAKLSEVAGNRFTDCALALSLHGSSRCRIVGNSFFGGRMGIRLRWDGAGNVFSANLFEDVRGPAVSSIEPFGSRAIYSNNVFSRCATGLDISSLPKDGGMSVRDNAFADCGTGILLNGGGTLAAPNNAIWRTKRPLEARKGAKLTAPSLVTCDPRFRDAPCGDYRLAGGSPLAGAGATGGNIGLFQ